MSRSGSVKKFEFCAIHQGYWETHVLLWICFILNWKQKVCWHSQPLHLVFSSCQNSNPPGSWQNSIEAFLNPYDFTTSTVKIRGEADFNLTRPLTYCEWTYHEHNVNTLWTYCEETADLRIWFTTSTVKIRGGGSSGSRPRRQKKRGTPCSTIRFESLCILAGFQCNFWVRICNIRTDLGFFLVSMICLLEIATFIHVPNLLCKFFCLQILKQLFVLFYVMPLWLSFRLIFTRFFLSGRCRFKSQVRKTFFDIFCQFFSSILHVGSSYYFCKSVILPKGIFSMAFWRMFKSIK